MGDYDIKDRIRQLRIAHGMSQQALADKLGVTNVAVSQWERGVKQPKMEMREALCDLFNVNMEYLNGNWDKISRLLTEEEAELIDRKRDGSDAGYYMDPAAVEIAQKIFENKEMRALFDAVDDITPDDLEAVYNIALALKRKERFEDD